LGADPATTADGLWHGLSEGLRESHSTGQALQERPLPHKSNPSTAESGIILPGTIVKRFATANQKRCLKFL